MDLHSIMLGLKCRSDTAEIHGARELAIGPLSTLRCLAIPLSDIAATVA